MNPRELIELVLSIDLCMPLFFSLPFLIVLIENRVSWRHIRYRRQHLATFVLSYDQFCVIVNIGNVSLVVVVEILAVDRA